MVAAYNAPENDADLVASFHSFDEAEAYTDEYGGEVERVGVVFTVGRGADHVQAKADSAAARNEPAPEPVESVDSIVARKVAEALAAARDSESDQSDD